MKQLTPHKISQIRDSYGWTTAKMAEFCNVSGSAARHWINGTCAPSGGAVRLLELLDAERIKGIRKKAITP